MITRNNRGPLLGAGALLGVGFGGFVDGILLHQILQAHNMLSARYPPTTLVNSDINMFLDGLFHAFCWMTALLGVALLWRAVLREDVPRSSRTFAGAMVFGWGLFNLVEGVIDHHILQVHHVVERLGASVWDYAFLCVGGVALIVLGGWLIRSGRGDDTINRDALTAP